jgi:hypothetical protein
VDWTLISGSGDLMGAEVRQSGVRDSRRFSFARVCRIGLILALLATLGLIYLNRQREESAQATFEIIICPDQGCKV